MHLNMSLSGVLYRASLLTPRSRAHKMELGPCANGVLACFACSWRSEQASAAFLAL